MNNPLRADGVLVDDYIRSLKERIADLEASEANLWKMIHDYEDLIEELEARL